MKRIVLIFLVGLAGCGDLADKNLSNWIRASDSRKNKVLADLSSKDSEFVKECMDRSAKLPNSGKVPVVSAKENCLTGLSLKNQNAKK